MRHLRQNHAAFAAAALLATLTACTPIAAESGSSQSIAEACELVARVPDQVDSDREGLLLQAVAETTKLKVEDIEKALAPVREQLSEAESQIENDEVKSAFTRYSQEVDSWSDLVTKRASDPSNEDGQELGQEEIDAYTADLADQESRIKSARDDLTSLCGE